MAISMAIAAPLLLLVLIFPAPSSAFSINFFSSNGSSAADVVVAPAAAGNGSVSVPAAGEVVYKDPLVFLGSRPGFSTYFSFALLSGGGEAGFAFFVAPAAAAASPAGRRVRAVFDAAFLVSRKRGRRSSFVEIDVGGERVVKSGEIPVLQSGKKLHCWVEYNGTLNFLRLWVGEAYLTVSAKPAVSYAIDLSDELWRRPMIVGFVVDGNSSRNCSLDLYSWAFEMRHGPPYRMHSQPLNPDEFLARPKNEEKLPAGRRNFFPFKVVMGMVFAALCGALVMFFLLFVWFALVAHRPVAPVEYPDHPADVVYEKVMLVEIKGTKDVEK